MRRKEIREQKSREEKKREEKREEKRREERKREENKIEEKEENRLCERERACILQTFYHKNIFKNTLNFKIYIIVKLNDIFEKNSCPNC